jgi:hypothetical protein
MTFVQVAEHNLPTKNKRSTRTLFSRHRLHPRLQAIKLLASLTYPLKITKGQTIPHPDTSHNLHLINIQHSVTLNSGCCGCRWHLKLKHQNLLLKRGNHRCPLLKLEVLLLIGMLKVYDHVSALIHQLVRCVKMLMNVVPHVGRQYVTFNSRSLSKGGTVPPWRRSFSHINCVRSREMVM